MKTKIYISIILVIILAFNISFAFADVIEPGQKQVNLSYQISNINNFPYYVFLLHGTPSPNYEILNASEFSLYKLSTASIYAVKRSTFNKNILTQANESAVDEYFNNNSDVIHSNLQLEGGYGNVDSNNQLENATIILEIETINDTSLEIKKSKIIYGFTDGSTQEQVFTNNSTPVPNKTKYNSVDYLWFLVLPILAAIAIAIVLLSKKKT